MTVPRKSAPAKKKTTKRAAGTSKPARGAKKSSAKSGKTRSVTSKPAKKTTKSASRSGKRLVSAKAGTKRHVAGGAGPRGNAKSKPDKAPAHKAATAKPTSGASEKKPAAPQPAHAPPPKPVAGEKQSKRKGISIHGDKPTRSPRGKQSITSPPNPHRTQLLGPNAPKRAPLIPSGPDAARNDGLDTSAGRKPAKSPFRKRELDKFRAVLLQKRAALVGDISQLESEALNLGRGELSHTPQHMAEQGSDSAEQTLALDLAAADRKLIREIDDAIRRMDEGRYGLCELTGRPIRVERLRELPWARYSIDAARELERRSPSGVW